MNKTDAILWAARLLEAIHALPEDADIYNFDLGYDHGNCNNRKITMLLYAPVDITPVFDNTAEDGWHSTYVNLTPFAQAWWAKKEVDSNDNG